LSKPFITTVNLKRQKDENKHNVKEPAQLTQNAQNWPERGMGELNDDVERRRSVFANE